ncbi:MAG: hypothetical protein ISS74_04675 [Planctomycetes bacterium]|nr:hypothetical protein [Planctomycetota bacterium]
MRAAVPNPGSPPCAGSQTAARRGAVLLEVVLAVAVFVGMAMAVLGGLSTCLKSARHVGLEAQATDLAVTLLSELQLDLLPVEDAGPEVYEDETLQEWTWQVAVVPIMTELAELEVNRVEITIRNTVYNYTYRLNYLLGVEPMEVGGGETME